jgi:two-component system invasion response regulator UvrY
MPIIARELKVSPKTVATYKYRIYEKLDVDTEVALLKLAIRSGLVDLNQIDSQPGLFEALV